MNLPFIRLITDAIKRRAGLRPEYRMRERDLTPDHIQQRRIARAEAKRARKRQRRKEGA